MHISSILESGGIQAMLDAQSNAQGMDSDVVAAVLSGIGSLASQGSAAEQIVAAGGIGVALEAMTTHVVSSSVARSCVRNFSLYWTILFILLTYL